MALKDVRLLLRDKVGFFFTFAFPLVMAIFFGVIFGGGGSGGGGGGGIKIAVVDADGTPGSADFVRVLESASELRVTRIESREQAERDVGRGVYTAAVTLPEGFGSGADRLFAGKGIPIEVAIDPSRSAETGMLQGLLTKYAFQSLQGMFTDPKLLRNRLSTSLEQLRSNSNPDDPFRSTFERLFSNLDAFAVDLDQTLESERAKDEGPGDAGAPGNAAAKTEPAAPTFNPVEITVRDVSIEPAPGTNSGPKPPRNAFAVSFPQGIIWGLIGCCMSFAVSLVIERERGTLLRLRVAPLSKAGILGGKALACAIVAGGIALGLLLIARLAFGVQPRLPLLILPVVACVVSCFVGIMMLIAALSPSEGAANGAGWGVLLLCAMFGGAMVPLFILPGWMQTASNISPIKWAILALESVIWRPVGPSDLVLPCAVLTVFGLATFSLGAWLFRPDRA